jgi:opacity protein-like surface antigen
MKKAIVLLLIPFYFHATAQDQNGNNKNQDQTQEVKKTGFQKDKLFTGGSANIGFSNGTTMLGITPQLGYSLTNWLDAGITFNLNYISQRDYYTTNKIRQTTFGPGAFMRIFPVNFLFAGAQYEYNMIHQKFISSSLPTEKNSVNANSLLVGAGYAGGRERGGNTYYYLSIMWDIAGDPNSPYVDNLGRSTPVIRAGYNIGLFQNRYGRGNRY